MLFYYLTIALQIYCFYHAYQNRSELYWYAIIFFLPVIGCLIYVFLKIINKKDSNVIGEEITTAINPGKRIKDLIEKVEFADTFSNRLALADAYLQRKEYENALENYEVLLDGAHKNDTYLQEQLVITNYHLKNYESVIELAKPLKANSENRALKVIFYLGLSYKALDKFNNAEKNLRALDIRYSNYPERLVLAQFLLEREKVDDAKELVSELLSEHNYMSKPNKRIYRDTFMKVKKLSDTLQLEYK
ncbi:hypothetical protein LX97_01482 [Nonlabens dokdonensis]|jgi:hypothetical protein|uniref:Tetratricopeptide repeat protein n=1 Tax=Nonlabens dokdonensis TaxID=328515 RepID=A0ABX5Q333_9FLAO|nr:hypothetical protein [Nonlabens dokdonensis]PZX44464.1 hypothetical protein LX97_01482 [Nonlabens dokdonensis]